ncbi:MAG: hypothetical protein WBG38_09700, partial [Nodosilinea sp.]
MTLAIGTTLKNGTYVIDAWVGDDSVGPVYLAMDVSRGQWLQIRVLGSRSPEMLPNALEREAFYCYLNQVKSLKHAALPQRLSGFEEDGVCYQTLVIPGGTSLDCLVSDAPLPPRVCLELIHQLTGILDCLRPLGWAGLRLAPDQVWFASTPQTLTFAGFDLPQLVSLDVSSSAVDSATAVESTLVRGLSHLLYFLLTGQRAELTKAPLSVELRRCHPALPNSLDAVLEAGSPAQQAASISLTEWKDLLPTAAQLPADLAQYRPLSAAEPAEAAPRQQAPVSRSEPKTKHSDLPARRAFSEAPPRRPAVLALVLTGLIATASGLGIGLYARFQPVSSASPERLNPNQSFPPLPDWNSSNSQPWEDAPTRRRPDYGNTPPPGTAAPDLVPTQQEPAAPLPAVRQPEPTRDPIIPAEEPVWETPAEPWS